MPMSRQQNLHLWLFVFIPLDIFIFPRLLYCCVLLWWSLLLIFSLFYVCVFIPRNYVTGNNFDRLLLCHLTWLHSLYLWGSLDLVDWLDCLWQFLTVNTIRIQSLYSNNIITLFFMSSRIFFLSYYLLCFSSSFLRFFSSSFIFYASNFSYFFDFVLANFIFSAFISTLAWILGVRVITNYLGNCFVIIGLPKNLGQILT